MVPPEQGTSGTDTACKSQPKSRVLPRRRIAWSDLLRRVFAIDALVCPACGGRMEMMGVVQAPGRNRGLVDGGTSRAPPVLHSAAVSA